MKPAYKESVKFLQKWCPGGPWVLTAIALDKKKIETKTFREPAEVTKWLENFGKNRNIYFSVNSCRYDVSKKPKREDVEALDWLHVDIDPRVGEDIDKERKRALASLQTPPAGIPVPTCVVFSGGGYQGFWRLESPKEIKGVQADFEDAKRYNQALELAFGADNCHNVDRIMRLPGTINRPDKRKLEKGRVEVLAELVEFSDTAYPLTEFAQANLVQSKDAGMGGNSRIKVSGNIKRIDDINDLGDKVSDLAKVVIVQGNDPDKPDRWAREKRSGALFFVCCELVRGDIDNDTIFSIITDPEFRISESVLEKGTSMERYALRQIERAREDAVDPHLAKLNDRYAVVTMGGKQRVIYEQKDEMLDRFRLVTMTFDDFQKKYMNRLIECGVDKNNNPRYMQLGKWWLHHRHRRQYEEVTFAPGKEVPDAYNMWQGYAVEAKPGDLHQLFLDHVLQNICGGSQEIFKYVIGWMASAVQRPGRPGETAIVLRGDQGVGKGILANTFGKLFGRHFLHISSAGHLVGNFNQHLRDCVVLFADEAFYAGDKSHAGTLKTLVTERAIMVTPKGIDSEMKASCLHIIMASNEDWVVPAGKMERRFCVLDVGQQNQQDSVYFGKLKEAMRDGGYENLLQYLLTYDLKDFNVRDLPKTKALREQKIHSLDPMESWWYHKLEDGKLLLKHEGWQKKILVVELVDDYVGYARSFNITAKRGTLTSLGKFLKTKACPGLEKVQGAVAVQMGEVTIQRPYYYLFPKLDELRKWWDSKFGGEQTWPEIKQLVEGQKKEEELPF